MIFIATSIIDLPGGKTDEAGHRAYVGVGFHQGVDAAVELTSAEMSVAFAAEESLMGTTTMPIMPGPPHSPRSYTARQCLYRPSVPDRSGLPRLLVDEG